MSSERTVRANISSTREVSTRLPNLSAVVSIPRQSGWAVRTISEIATVVRGLVIRAVTAEDALQSQSVASLQSALEDAEERSPAGRWTLMEACKTWCTENRRDPHALKAFCEYELAPIDMSIVSMIADASARFAEMNRSKVLGALAVRVLKADAAIASPGCVMHLLQAANELPWEAQGHETIATALLNLDKGLDNELYSVRQRFETAIGQTLEQCLLTYARHERVAVAETIARECEREPVLLEIAERAMDVVEIEPRLGFKLIAAISSNVNATPAVLSKFTDSTMWRTADSQHSADALENLLKRAARSSSRDAEASQAYEQ